MTETTPNAEKIARSLTEAQRNALLFPNGYHDPNTVKAIRRKGLMQGAALTETGLAVREILRREA